MIQNRLSELFRRRFGVLPEKCTELPQSGSHRRYFRLEGAGTSSIGVSGTVQMENRAFCALGRHFRSKGINVPEVLEVSDDFMEYLLEDLGDVSLFDAVAPGRESGVYSPEERSLLVKAVSGLPAIQFAAAEGLDFNLCYPSRKFDGRMVMADLNYFKYCFLKISGVEYDEVRLQDDFERLMADIAAIPAGTFMYRDFQSRNVMIKDGEPYYIDFQGGLEGPFYYDLASFVWQARAGYPDDLRSELIKAYIGAMPEHCRPDTVDFHETLRLFVLLRTLQVLGAYGFRGFVEKKDHFLKSIPAAIRNLKDLMAVPFSSYPYLNSLLSDVVNAYENGSMRLCGGFHSLAYPVAGGNGSTLTVTVWSFSYKKGIPDDSSGNGGGYVFDCRSIHNPGKYDRYKSLTGMDDPVVRFLEDDGEVFRFLDNVYRLVDAHAERFISRGFTSLMVSFGCTGGQHRSVYCAESLSRHLSRIPGIKVHLIHREQGVDRWL